MEKLTVRLIRGALAGSLAAACMTVIRMAAHRRGIIEKTVPQAAEERLSHRFGLGRNAHPIVHHLTDQAMHIGYGASLGAAYALVARGRSSSFATRGLGYGIGTWLFGSWLLLPLLRAKQAAWRKRPSENVVDLVAHLVFGAATALVSEELAAQSDRGPSSDSARRQTRVG
jgi:uncharacterized membrane protein YagU involved in acid resistance